MPNSASILSKLPDAKFMTTTATAVIGLIRRREGKGPGLKGIFRNKYLPQTGLPANDDRVTDIIRNGRPDMPGYSQVLSAQDISRNGSLICTRSSARRGDAHCRDRTLEMRAGFSRGIIVP